MADHSNLAVLVVDDEHVISRTLAEILRHEGFTVDAFTDPLAALEHTHDHPPDLLITDVVMPQLSGVELAVEVSKKHPKCRILLFSGQAGTVDLMRAARKRGHDFPLLSKPMHPTKLIAEIKKLSAQAVSKLAG